jgi:hypothetical protein
MTGGSQLPSLPDTPQGLGAMHSPAPLARRRETQIGKRGEKQLAQMLPRLPLFLDSCRDSHPFNLTPSPPPVTELILHKRGSSGSCGG